MSSRLYASNISLSAEKFCADREKGTKKYLLADLIVNLINCSDLIKMYEKSLPPAVKKSSLLTKGIRDKAIEWINKISLGLEQYVAFKGKSLRRISR